jgi:hypothetical protein
MSNRSSPLAASSVSGAAGEAQCLVDLVIEVAASDVALVGEEQVTAQRMQALALVQLPPDSPTEFLISNVSTEVEGADEPAVFLQGAGEPVLSAAGVQLGDQQVAVSTRIPSTRRAGADRSSDRRSAGFGWAG